MTGTKMLEAFQDNGALINKTDLLTTPIEDLDTDDAHVAWSVLDIIEEIAGARKGALRERLLEDAKGLGKLTDKGHYELEVAMGKVTAQKSVKRGSANQEAVRELLMSKKIPVNSVLVRKTVVDFDSKAFDALVKDGQLTQAEADAIYGTAKESFSLKVEKPGFLKKAITEG